MKKLLILTLVGGLAMSASAQTYRNHDERYSSRMHRDFRNDRREIDRRIAVINYQYDSKIENVRHNVFMRSREKRRAIRKLQRDRKVALDNCRRGFSSGYADGRRDMRRSNRW